MLCVPLRADSTAGEHSPSCCIALEGKVEHTHDSLNRVHVGLPWRSAHQDELVQPELFCKAVVGQLHVDKGVVAVWATISLDDQYLHGSHCQPVQGREQRVQDMLYTERPSLSTA
jgi:hypothetical protein